MIPKKILTGFAKFQEINSVNDFWFPRRLQESFVSSFPFAEKFLFCIGGIATTALPNRFVFANFCNIRALLFLLDTDILVSNLFLYPESLAYLCVPFVVLLPIDPSPNFLRSVVPDMCHRVSFTRLAHWQDHWPNVSLLQQNPTCLEPTNSHLVASILFRSKLRLPSNVGLIRRHKIVQV